jgi:hypothetical protein
MNLYPDKGYILDLYKSSMARAKSLGYNVNFYGDTDSINIFSGILDRAYDISHKEFLVVDDLKLYIHSQHNLDCVTIDGDLILEDELKFPDPNSNHVYFDFPETKNDILKEENNIYNGYGDLKMIFKKYNAMDYFPYFNYDNPFACNTGIIKFNDQETKNLFLSEFNKIQKFFAEKIQANEGDFNFKQIRFIIAQYYYGCLIKNLKIPACFLSGYNRYEHFYGNKKFESRTKHLVYKILMDCGL